MSFVLRGIEPQDLNSLYGLASQFVLLNLPADKKVLTDKIEKSVASFNGELEQKDAEYLFVVEDLEAKAIVGSSQVIAKHGTPDNPNLSFKVLQKNRMSQDLGVGFMHKILRFHEEPDGPTEVGGLIVDRSYRRRPEKVGRQVSLVRFLFMAISPDSFQENILCELTPPLTDEGRSEFWEALGRRFTGLPYQEADQLSRINKGFIQDLFPEEDIYLSLLDSKARLVMGQVGESTRPAQHLLKSMGFSYIDEVDPFDGGPYYGAKMSEITLVKNTEFLKLGKKSSGPYSKMGLVGQFTDGKFRAIQTAYEVDGNELQTADKCAELLGLNPGDPVAVSGLS